MGITSLCLTLHLDSHFKIIKIINKTYKDIKKHQAIYSQNFKINILLNI